MRGRLITVFFVLLGCFIAATIFRVDQILFADKIAFSEASARAQSGALSEAMATELKSLRESLELATPELFKNSQDYPKNKPYSQFEMIAKLSRKPTGEWAIEPRVFKQGSQVKSWAMSYVNIALQGLNQMQLGVGESRLLSLMDPQRRPYFLFVTRLVDYWAVGVTAPDLFQSVVDRQKGLKTSVYAVNELGQTLAHTTPEYVGTMLTDDPVVTALQKSESGSGSGVYGLGAASVQGIFEKIPSANVFVVVSFPLKDVMAERKSVRMQFVFLGGGFLLLAVALVLAVVTRERRHGAAAVHVGPRTIPQARAAAAGPVAETKIVHVPDPQERMKAYTQAASSLAHEMRGPLLSLLGRARLLREQTQDSNLQQEMLKIEEGAREAHSTLHKLLTFAGEKDEPATPTSLAEAVQRAVKIHEGEINRKNIKIETHIQPGMDLIEAPPVLLTKAIDQMLKNSIEACERVYEKKITLHLEQSPFGQKLSIIDTGEGMTEASLQKAFDPFFTTKNAAQHSGLGLPLAMGIIKSCGGTIEAFSEKGKGTRFEVSFPTNVVQGVTVPAPPPPSVEDELGPAVGNVPRTEMAPQIFAPPSPPPPPAELPAVLNDKLMEKTLDMIDRLDSIEDLFAQSDTQKLPPAPTVPVAAVEKSDSDVEATVTIELPPPTKQSSKIDAPKISLPKKSTKVTGLPTEIRRPGERS